MIDEITLPVQATMTRQPDGSYKMTEATYINTSADAVARFLSASVNVPATGGR